MAEQVRLARAAQAPWGLLPPARRLAVFRRWRHAIAGAGERLAGLAADQGRTPAESLAAEVLPLADACRFLERRAPALLASRRLRRGRPLWLAGLGLEVRREPAGVVLVVGPGNYPLLLPGVQALQALAAGNAVLLKPAPGRAAPLAALAALAGEAGLPEDLCQLLPEEPEAVAAAVAAGVDHLVLTGSAATGRAVLAGLAPRLVPATMELSGCEAVFVLPGADLDLAARGLAFGLAFNASRTCIAPRRVFVPRELEEELGRRLAAALAGAPPLPVAPAAAALARALAAEARAAGARLVAGDQDPGERMRPLVLAGVPPGCRLLAADLFAPVLALVPVAGEEEALAAAAVCPYALGAVVFGPEGPARRLAARLPVGQVAVNDLIVPTADPRLPFGGRRESGFGVTRGAEGLLELTRVKAVAVRRGRWRPHFAGLPPAAAELLRHYLQAVHGAGFRARLRAWARLFGAARRAGRERR